MGSSRSVEERVEREDRLRIVALEQAVKLIGPISGLTQADARVIPDGIVKPMADNLLRWLKDGDDRVE